MGRGGTWCLYDEGGASVAEVRITHLGDGRRLVEYKELVPGGIEDGGGVPATDTRDDESLAYHVLLTRGKTWRPTFRRRE